eukprot:gb/GEZJ01000974.1/.p3 GENE.gb/GEZJ01000974.1/~~gb/GEZJ01000974.1/.p3  ORF type:complete len:196 (-),score=20.16 gb/GEZJ01000974.1/:1513-2100(-)
MSVGKSAPHIFTAICSDPYRTISQVESAIQTVHESVEGRKKYEHTRLCHVPASPDTVKRNVSALQNRDLHELISIIGIVTRTGSIVLREEQSEFFLFKLHALILVTGDITISSSFDLSSRCPRPDKKPCYRHNFTAKTEIAPRRQEYQEIKVQDNVQHFDVGFIPRSLLVILTDYIADTVKLGDDAFITGALHRR